MGMLIDGKWQDATDRFMQDGNHNPFGIIGQQPEIDWLDTSGL